MMRTLKHVEVSFDPELLKQLNEIIQPLTTVGVVGTPLKTAINFISYLNAAPEQHSLIFQIS